MPRYRRVKRYRRIQNNEKVKDYKKRAARNRIKCRLLGMAFLIVLLSVIVRFIPMFNITNISVVGNERVDSKEIISQSGINLGDNWVYCRTHRAESKIGKLVYTKSVKVKKVFPNKIRIIFVENTPFGYLRDTDDRYVLVSSEGIVMEIVDALPEGERLAEIITPNVADPTVGEVFDQEKSVAATNFRTLLKSLKKSDLIDNVTMVDITSGETISIKYNHLKVVFGNMDKLDYKITNLKTILKQLKEDAEGRLDLSVPGKSYYRENDDDIYTDKSADPEESENAEGDKQ